MKNRINKILKSINDPKKTLSRQCELQLILRELVSTWGIENVALASGLTESTLRQYIRVKKPSTIGEQSVQQAVNVFNQL